MQNALVVVVVQRDLGKLKRNAVNENPTKRPEVLMEGVRNG